MDTAFRSFDQNILSFDNILLILLNPKKRSK